MGAIIPTCFSTNFVGPGPPLLVSHDESSLLSWTLIPGGLTVGLHPSRGRINLVWAPTPRWKAGESKESADISRGIDSLWGRASTRLCPSPLLLPCPSEKICHLPMAWVDCLTWGAMLTSLQPLWPQTLLNEALMNKPLQEGLWEEHPATQLTRQTVLDVVQTADLARGGSWNKGGECSEPLLLSPSGRNKIFCLTGFLWRLKVTHKAGPQSSQFASPRAVVLEFQQVRWGLRVRISPRFPGDTDAASQHCDTCKWCD